MNPTADLLNQKLWAWSPEVCVAKVVQVISVHCIKSLVTVDLKKRDCSSGRYATQSVLEVRVRFCKDRAIAGYQAAAPARKSRVCCPAQQRQGGMGPATGCPGWVVER